MDKKGGTTRFKAWLIVMIALLDDIAALALVFLLLRIFDVKIPIPVMIIIGVVLGTIIFFIHRAVVPSLRRKNMMGSEGMIGTTGQVTESLKPGGTVKIKDEYWKAMSVEGEIEVGGEVEVTGINGLNLEVRKKSR